MMASTLSCSVRRFTALAASTLSDLLSTTTSSTGRSRTVGFELVGKLHVPLEFKLPTESVLPVRGQIDADFDGIGGLCRKPGRPMPMTAIAAMPFKVPSFMSSILQKRLLRQKRSSGSG